MVCVHCMDFDVILLITYEYVLYSTFLCSTPASNSPVLATETVELR